MDLEKLKRNLQESLGLSGHVLSDEEFTQLVTHLKSAREDIKSGKELERELEELIPSITEFDGSVVQESIDSSDLDHLIDQIEDALKKRPK